VLNINQAEENNLPNIKKTTEKCILTFELKHLQVTLLHDNLYN